MTRTPIFFSTSDKGSSMHAQLRRLTTTLEGWESCVKVTGVWDMLSGISGRPSRLSRAFEVVKFFPRYRQTIWIQCLGGWLWFLSPGNHATDWTMFQSKGSDFLSREGTWFLLSSRSCVFPKMMKQMRYCKPGLRKALVLGVNCKYQITPPEHRKAWPVTFSLTAFLNSVRLPLQGSYPFSETNFQDFSRTFPGVRLIFQGL